MKLWCACQGIACRIFKYLPTLPYLPNLRALSTSKIEYYLHSPYPKKDITETRQRCQQNRNHLARQDLVGQLEHVNGAGPRNTNAMNHFLVATVQVSNNTCI
jgi:hypothetical protein